MKNIIILITIVFFASVTNGQEKTLYEFSAKTIDGKDFDFSTLKGKKVLIVNTASRCGLTYQYEGLQKLYEDYGSDEFTMIGFPANNFNNQEPGTNEEISEFCQINFGVTFQMMEKISVKGDDIHPIYQWLTSKSENGKIEAPVSWNFQKFFINKEGKVVDFAEPTTEPQDEKIINWIENKI